MNTFRGAIACDWAISFPFVMLLVVASMLDIAFGLAVAFCIRKDASSTTSRTGTARKLLMLLSVLVAAIFDGALPTVSMWGHLVTFAAVASGWWIVVELLSIVEKSAMIGLPMPSRLRAGLIKVRDSIDAAIPVPTSPTDSAPEPDPTENTPNP